MTADKGEHSSLLICQVVASLLRCGVLVLARGAAEDDNGGIGHACCLFHNLCRERHLCLVERLLRPADTLVKGMLFLEILVKAQ